MASIPSSNTHIANATALGEPTSLKRYAMSSVSACQSLILAIQDWFIPGTGTSSNTKVAFTRKYKKAIPVVTHSIGLSQGASRREVKGEAERTRIESIPTTAAVPETMRSAAGARVARSACLPGSRGGVRLFMALRRVRRVCGMTAAAVGESMVVNAIGFPLLSALVIARLDGMRVIDRSTGTNNETHTVAA
jgi:hypothetical protein